MDRHASGADGRNGSSSTVGAGAADVDALEFAEYLRAERERRRLTLEQVADETKIASRHLAALERGDVRSWPGGMYRRAMMRAYAESIGVDREFALRQFEQAFEPPPTSMEAPPPASEARRPVPIARWRPSRRDALAAACASLAIVALVIVWQVAGAFFGNNEDVASTPAAGAAPAPAPAPPPAARASAPQVAAPEPQPSAALPSVRATVATTGNAPARPLATAATLVVESDPPGARVTVNGIGWGETPITIRHLEFGSKRVRLTLQGYLSEERIVNVEPGRPDGRVRIPLRERR